jgi:hypothetical protein
LPDFKGFEMPLTLTEQIDQTYQLKYCYHMTHLSNLQNVAQNGALFSYNKMRGHSYFNIANEDVQAGRAGITVPCSNRNLHDYVPLYLGFKTPMVAVNKQYNKDLLFIRFKLEILTLRGVVVTDGNARSNGTQFRLYTSINDLSFWDAKAIRALKYAHDPEVKRKKQTEILVPDSLAISNAMDIICFSDEAKIAILACLNNYGTRLSVLVNPNWYFPING